MSATIHIRGTKELKATLRKLGADAPRAAGSALYVEGERVMSMSKPLVPVDMGPLRASGHVQLPKITRTSATVTLGYGGAGSEYALYQHEGVGPAVGHAAFMPPVDVIKAWVKRNIAPPAKDLDSIAFLVARSIGQKGFKGKKFLSGPLQDASKGMAGRLAKRMNEWLETHRAAR